MPVSLDYLPDIAYGTSALAISWFSPRDIREITWVRIWSQRGQRHIWLLYIANFQPILRSIQCKVQPMRRAQQRSSSCEEALTNFILLARLMSGTHVGFSGPTESPVTGLGGLSCFPLLGVLARLQAGIEPACHTPDQFWSGNLDLQNMQALLEFRSLRETRTN